MRIERLPERLYDAAVQLWQDSGLTRPWNDPEADLRRAVGGSSSCVLAAIGDDDGLLATAMVGHDGHRGWVYYLAVDATHRGRGLGRQMMEACEDWVRSQGMPKIQLMVRAANRVTMGFYEHLGYADSEVVVLGRRLDGLGVGRGVAAGRHDPVVLGDSPADQQAALEGALAYARQSGHRHVQMQASSCNVTVRTSMRPSWMRVWQRGSGVLAGPQAMLPSANRKVLPCHGQVTQPSLIVPSSSGPPRYAPPVSTPSPGQAQRPAGVGEASGGRGRPGNR